MKSTNIIISQIISSQYLIREVKMRLHHAKDEEYYVLCHEYSHAVNQIYGLCTIPDVLLNLCLGFQIKRISRQESDPLLLPPGSILLLLQQHFGETL